MEQNETRLYNQRKIALTECVKRDDNQQIIARGIIGSPLLTEGRFLNYRYGDGIVVQGGTTAERCSCEVISSASPSLSLVFILEGNVTFGFDDEAFELHAGTPVDAVAINLTKPVRFRRILKEENNVKKLNIALAPHWLERHFGAQDAAYRFTFTHLASQTLHISAQMRKLITQLLNPPSPSTLQEKLAFECTCHQLIALALEQLQPLDLESDSPSRQRQLNLLEPVLAHIDANLNRNLELSHLAQLFSISVSKLQRVFSQALGLSANAYIRYRRLQLAKIHLESGLMSVTEAAYESGYQHPSNFTSAFKRHFGVAPHTIAKPVTRSTIN
ncbi:AraC family transcriptional regulator [Vibrio vulnificus]|nr:AraC family transcriptional regulator [Vibrio vulnificus]EGR7974096.1 helix-turn-helix transcriptional regulator [Vibrio vulnificus]MCU8108154.1 AraC family transcriptional regulator [Vibrio vulnificus]